MYFDQLRYMKAVAEAGSIKAAAVKLGVSRAAVSMSLKNLEEELGFCLFHKGASGAHLTPEGEQALLSVNRILEEEDLLRSLRQNIAGSVAVCATPILSHYLTSCILVPFRQQQPRITVLLRNALTTEVFRHMEGGGIPIAVSGATIGMNLCEEAERRGYEAVVLYTDERRLFFSSKNPLAGKPELAPEDLKQLPLACYSPAGEHFSQHYLPYFSYAYRLANRGDLLEMALEGEAALIQPARMFRHHFYVAQGLLVERRLPIPDMDHHVPVMALRHRELSAPAKQFWQFLVSSFTKGL